MPLLTKHLAIGTLAFESWLAEIVLIFELTEIQSMLIEQLQYSTSKILWQFNIKILCDNILAAIYHKKKLCDDIFIAF